MAESPRTAQNVDYIMKDAEDIRSYLEVLIERGDDTETKKIQKEMLTAIYRLTAAIDDLRVDTRAGWLPRRQLTHRPVGPTVPRTQ